MWVQLVSTGYKGGFMFKKKFQFVLSVALMCSIVVLNVTITRAEVQSDKGNCEVKLYSSEGKEINLDSTADIAYHYSNNTVMSARQQIIDGYKQRMKGESLLSEFNSVEEAVDYECVKENTVWYRIPDYWNSEFKAYESYTSITDRTSMQFPFLYGENAWTNLTNGIRCNGNRYCIALGSGFGHLKVGTKVDVVLYNGNIIHCVIGDVKKDIHTIGNHMQCPNGSIIEFIVDWSVFSYLKDSSGTINFVDGMDGKIRNIIVLNE